MDPFLQLFLDLAVAQPREQPGGVHRTVVVEPRTNEQLEQLLERSKRGQRPQASGPDTERITSSGTRPSSGTRGSAAQDLFPVLAPLVARHCSECRSGAWNGWLAEQLRVKSPSRSQVSEMPLTWIGRSPRSDPRPLDAGPYTLVRLDALTVKVREDGRVPRLVPFQACR